MRNRTVLLVTALILGAVGGPVVGVAGAQEVTLTVTVVTAAGDPVSGADLTVTWDDGSDTVTTRSSGQALVDVPEGADVTIEVDHPGYVRNELYTVTDASQEEVEVTVYQKSSLSLAVSDADGPVEGVRVVLRKGGAVVEVLSTDARGEVESGVIEAGEYTVNLFEPGYYQQVVALTIRGDTSDEVEVERGSVSVEFRVFDDNFDPPQPVANANIRGDDFSVATGSDGRREVSVPVNTDQTVTVEKEGYDTVERSIAVREQNLEVEINTRKQDVVHVAVSNERIVVGESVQVTVTDQYGEPRPEATVYLDGESVGSPDNQGVLRVEIESGGEHTLFAQSDQLSSERLTVTGIQSGDDGADETEPGTVVSDGSAPQPAGFLAVPGLGPLHLRSLAIGAAAGLVLSALLFLYARLG
jgi:hypothetical protein